MSRYTLDPKTQRIYERLLKIRPREGLKISRRLKNLRETFVTESGEERDLVLRDYQVIGVLHLAAMGRFILGDDTGLGKCVVGDTLVKTDKGLVDIRSLNPDITVPDTFKPVEGLNVVVGGKTLPVSKFYYGGVKPTFKIRTHHGFEVEGSHVHPVLVRREGGTQWVQLRDVRRGDYVCVDRSLYEFNRAFVELPSLGRQNNEKVYKTPSVMGPELARFLGYLVGEGWFNHDYRLFVSQNSEANPEVCADIEALIPGLFSYPVRKSGNEYKISSRYLVRWLQSIGVALGVAREKEVPWCILQADQDSVRHFVKALVDAEGHAHGDGIEVSSASEKLLKQLQTLLLGFGVVSRRSPKKVKGYDHTYWRLTILGEDARVYMERVGLVSNRKIEALAPLMKKWENPNLDVIPHTRSEVEGIREELYEVCGRHGYKGGGITKELGNSLYNSMGHVRHGRRQASQKFLQGLVGVASRLGIGDSEGTKRLRLLLSRGWKYDPVVSIEEGKAEVYDIEVADPSHSFVGNGVVNHNTLQSITGLCYLWDKNPNQKALILTTKSAVPQWADEFEKFTTGVHVTAMTGGRPKKREKQYAEFIEAEGPSVIIMNYTLARVDFSRLQHMHLDAVIFDEATAFKSPKSQIHQVCKYLAKKEGVKRVWGLTATLIKNNLIEGYGIYSVVVPGMFGTQTAFMRDFCITRLQKLPKSNRQIPVIIGYRPEDIEEFRNIIDPHFLGRPKHEVATELPTVTFRMIKFGMSGAQTSLYHEALSGFLMVQNKETGEYEEKEVNPLTACTRLQQIVDHPDLIGREGGSAKLNLLKDILKEGDLADEKVIVFTRYAEMVKIILKHLNNTKEKRKNKYAVSISGLITDIKKRRAAMRQFQDTTSETKVIVITTAGSDAINLQAAKGLICYDTPWSAGEYLQLLGRMVRIGSNHDRVYALHLCARGSIDMRVNQVLRSKMKLVEAVLGKRIKGESKDVILAPEGDVKAIFEGIMEDARKLRSN